MTDKGGVKSDQFKHLQTKKGDFMFYKTNNVSTGVCLLFTAILTATTIQFNIQKEELEEEKNKLTNDIEDLREENVKLTNEL